MTAAYVPAVWPAGRDLSFLFASPLASFLSLLLVPGSPVSFPSSPLHLHLCASSSTGGRRLLQPRPPPSSTSGPGRRTHVTASSPPSSPSPAWSADGAGPSCSVRRNIVTGESFVSRRRPLLGPISSALEGFFFYTFSTTPLLPTYFLCFLLFFAYLLPTLPSLRSSMTPVLIDKKRRPLQLDARGRRISAEGRLDVKVFTACWHLQADRTSIKASRSSS